MKSPFPGMDPFLERHWTGVHTLLIVYALDQLQPQLPDALWARTEERLIVESDDRRLQRAIFPDVHVTERMMGGDEQGGVAVAAETAVAEPLVIEVEDEPLRQRSIEILDVETGERVVTCIEFLSPTNKRRGDGQKQYRQKQEECLEADVNLVEVDLTRAGERQFLVPMELIPATHRTTYQACIWRAAFPTRYEVYAMPLQARLPVIRVPLRPDDKDVVLDLQALVEQAYERGRYDRIDYTRPLDPSLSGGDAEWVQEQLRKIS